MHHLESVMTQEKLVNAFQLYFLLYNLNLFPLRTKFKRSYNLASTIHGCAKHVSSLAQVPTNGVNSISASQQ